MLIFKIVGLSYTSSRCRPVETQEEKKAKKGRKNMAARTTNHRRERASCSGYELREMFLAGTRWLEKNAAAINALNVFPVPDGDTGTNMVLTMRSTMEETARIKDNNASTVAQAVARGGLMGARGNSGVILSQILRGIADGLRNVVSFGTREMAQAFEKASILAYKGISKPKEGTMLTVIKDVSTVANESVKTNNKDLVSFMETVVQEARKSVERTPDLLDVLKEAGVVDAGGQGIYILLEGILFYLRGEAEQIEMMEIESPAALQPAFMAARSTTPGEKVYGYCTQFLIKGENLSVDQVRDEIADKGDSIVVVGDETTVKVHIHTTNPGAILELGTSIGSLHDLEIQNMDDQHEEFVQMRRAPIPPASIAVVSVVCGEGLEDVFYSLGTSAIVSGGQTMNPSTEEILQAIDSVPSDKVIVLPNNKNVVLTAQQAASLSTKKVQVLPTKSVPQGLTALLAFNSETELEDNLSAMSRAQQGIKSIEITQAVREAQIGKIHTRVGDFIGLIDGELVTSGENLFKAVSSTAKEANLEDAELVTLYYGADIEGKEAEELAQALKADYPALDLEVVKGGQPHYCCIMSVE
jgi:DAK2 domain fusion protein YloV